jgi:preprotein translocase subunit SecG
MGIISILLLVIFAIGAVVLILVILLQDDQGEGLAGMFGGGTATTQVGSRAGNALTRFTSILAAIFIVGAFALAWVNRTPRSADILERARAEQLHKAESNDWWVERLDQQQAPAGGSEAAAPGTGGAVTAGAGAAPASGQTGGTSQDSGAAPSSLAR